MPDDLLVGPAIGNEPGNLLLALGKVGEPTDDGASRLNRAAGTRSRFIQQSRGQRSPNPQLPNLNRQSDAFQNVRIDIALAVTSRTRLNKANSALSEIGSLKITILVAGFEFLERKTASGPLKLGKSMSTRSTWANVSNRTGIASKRSFLAIA